MKLNKMPHKKVRLSSYVWLAFLVIAIVISGYQSNTSTDVKPGRLSKVLIKEGNQSSLDKATTAEMASLAAQSADLAVAGDVTLSAISLNLNTQLAQADTTLLSKPPLINSSATGARGIREYTAVAGDTSQSVATRYEVSEDTIRWSNNLTGSAIPEGKKLLIPGLTGIIYTVKPGDTPESLAQKYQSETSRIITYNDAELTGLVPGQRIVLPGGILPETERPGYSDTLANRQASRTLASIRTSDVTAAPIGRVRAGDIIGYVGNTGFSTGPHAHLEARLNSRIVDPDQYFFSGEWQKPLTATVSQSYGNPSSWYVRGYHPGTDYDAQMGTPLRAVADGMLYRGCTAAMFGPGYGNAYGYVAVIDHGNGLQSLYGHMIAGPDGAACDY